MTMPSGSAVGMSLAEWTAISTAPARSASSISLVNRPLPPASISGRSVMRSPVVRIGDDQDRLLRERQRRREPARVSAGLGERQRAAAGADADLEWIAKGSVRVIGACRAGSL